MLSCEVVPDSFVTPWAAIRQAPLSMEFSRQEYWSGLPFPSPGTYIYICTYLSFYRYENLNQMFKDNCFVIKHIRM